MTIAIASGGGCIETKNGIYVCPTNWKSFSQWVCLFRKPRLIMIRSNEKSPPEGWIQVPENIETCVLDVLSKNHLSRRQTVFKAAAEYLRGVELLYARMLAYEVYWTFCVAAKQKVPLLLELHGDWETAALFSGVDRGFLMRATRQLRAGWAGRATLKMANSAFAVVSIGPVLAEKYVKGKKPVLISTNNPLDENQYHQRQEHDLKPVPRLLFVGDLSERKGLRYLFASLKELKKMGRKFEMVLAGSGPEEV